MSADYQVYFINPANDDIVYFVDGGGIYRLEYERILNDISAFTIELSGDNDVFNIIPFDTVIEVRRLPENSTTQQVENYFIVRSISRVRSGNNERFVVGGLSFEYLLSGRLIDPNDDPNEAGGYSTKAGAADDVIREYVREQAADLASAGRSIPDFTVDATSSVGNSVGKRLRYDNLWKIVQELIEAGEVDLSWQRQNDGTGAFSMQVGIVGQDRSFNTTTPTPPYTILSPARGNIQAPQYTVDKKSEVTSIYAFSDGEGANQIKFIIESGTQNDSPFSRREEKLEIRQSDRTDITEIVTGAIAKLSEKKPEIDFSFEIIQGAGGAVYREDFDLGDYVTLQWDSVMQNVRITKIDVSLGNDGEQIKIEVTNDRT